MEKIKQEFSNPFAPVNLSPVTVGGDEIASKIAVQVQADDGSWSKTPCIVSKDYRLIQNSVCKDVADDIMSRSGMEWKVLKTLWDGKRYCAFHVSVQSVASYTEKRNLHVGMMVRNSYDGSGVFGVELFAADLHCTNQFHDRKRFGFFAIRHDTAERFQIQDALQNLTLGVQNIMAVAPKLSELRNTPLMVHHLVTAKEYTALPKTMWHSVIDQLGVEEGTLFGLLQALTFVASHEISGFNQISVGESIMSHFIGGKK